MTQLRSAQRQVYIPPLPGGTVLMIPVHAAMFDQLQQRNGGSYIRVDGVCDDYLCSHLCWPTIGMAGQGLVTGVSSCTAARSRSVHLLRLRDMFYQSLQTQWWLAYDN